MRLDHPERAFRVVHIAGSKGKGSTASLIGTALRHAGHRVGTYGSPHVETIHERVRIDGAPIDDEGFARAASAALDAAEAADAEGTDAAEASWFDIVTATGLVAFRNAEVDWAVLEVGLGGRLDSTNVIDVPDVAVVTTIALEHTAILGDTHAKIALEKAGIVKAGGLFVSGCDPASEAGEVFRSVAEERRAPHTVAWSPADATFEEHNVRVARAALGLIDGPGPVHLTDAAIADARLPGRMESRTSPAGLDVVLDGAHVRGSIEAALREARRGRSEPPLVVMAIHSDKDAAELLAPLAGRVAGLVATSIPTSGVHLAAGKVKEAAEAAGIRVVATLDDPVDALTAAECEGRWLFITGSLYLVGAVRGRMRKILPGD